MLASTPSRNSRPELIADDGQGVLLLSRPRAWAGPDQREAVPWPEFTRSNNTSDPIDSAMPEKTLVEGALIFHTATSC